MVILPFYQVGNEYDTSDPALSGSLLFIANNGEGTLSVKDVTAFK